MDIILIYICITTVGCQKVNLKLKVTKPYLFSVFPRQAVADYTNKHSKRPLSAFPEDDQEKENQFRQPFFAKHDCINENNFFYVTATWPLRDHAFKLEPVFRLIISRKPERGRAGESGGGRRGVERSGGGVRKLHLLSVWKKTATEKLPSSLVRRALQTFHRDLF